MTPVTARAWILIIMRDLVIPGAGVWMAIHAPPLYLLPLIAGMLSVPLVGRSGNPEPDDRPDPEEG
jgi:hypothetical protein